MISLFNKKINKNLYFFNGISYLFKSKRVAKEEIIKKIIFIYLKIIKKQYNFVFIDLSKTNFDSFNKIILRNSDINFVVMEPNMLGINEIKRMLKIYFKEWKINKNNLHIISNKRNFNSINKNLIYHFLFQKNKIYDVKANKIFYYITNNYFRQKCLLKNEKIKKEINKIIYNIIMK